jgi:energy-converting hydrogenase Eha subunit C
MIGAPMTSRPLAVPLISRVLARRDRGRLAIRLAISVVCAALWVLILSALAWLGVALSVILISAIGTVVFVLTYVATATVEMGRSGDGP